MTVPPARRRYVVTADQRRHGLVGGTVVEESGRFEAWDHHGCIDSIRSTVANLTILNGSRAGQIVEVTVESGYEDESPFEGSRPTWLAPLVGDERPDTSAVARRRGGAEG